MTEHSETDRLGTGCLKDVGEIVKIVKRTSTGDFLLFMIALQRRGKDRKGQEQPEI
jgi:hypothetical protein